mmetsp:Transcript_24321/g.57245  ORF Transcript_24321/g.57245 Transcript_24321/m.57245 type:complete len:244 (+) Transcript_24321:134-865(+)|eukprot:CAMPEP_0197192466 /NCGR_PEP_ID=MMETSP1423-20130617/25117_1 /TAXON_ID=476441 /ORGANISM="Pseudo-nitzschia heimii, Strain UNC1101" /LENGTH=243 /DNA_ID=CAMNT_0042645347 /DNA_START=45 /DNA_END=776 /DNA_ORIENTATION=+
MTIFTRFGSSVSKSYLASLNESNPPSSGSHTGGSNDEEFGISDEVDALRWKLFGKNEEFRIMHDAAITIQSFWRGCFSRARTSEKIESLIEDIVAFQELEARYKRKYEEEIQQQRQENEKDRDLDNKGSDGDDKHDPYISSGSAGSVRRKEKNKPWRMLSESGKRGDEVSVVSMSSSNLSKVTGAEEKEPLREEGYTWTTNHVSTRLLSMDDETRGYRRYKTNIHGRNKSRPWRDDTNLFDAY